MRGSAGGEGAAAGPFSFAHSKAECRSPLASAPQESIRSRLWFKAGGAVGLDTEIVNF